MSDIAIRVDHCILGGVEGLSKLYHRLRAESYAIAGDSARATALWRTVDLSLGQLPAREWWYGAVGETAVQRRITQAIQQLNAE